MCESWMEMNLISNMSYCVQLRDVPLDLLTKTIKSSRLEFFIYNNAQIIYLMQVIQLHIHKHNNCQQIQMHCQKSCIILEAGDWMAHSGPCNPLEVQKYQKFILLFCDKFLPLLLSLDILSQNSTLFILCGKQKKSKIIRYFTHGCNDFCTKCPNPI